jgi:isoleucyl-tRNA synthetase
MSREPYRSVTAVPDRVAIERTVAERWEQTGVFEELRARNAGGPPFSFLDGPITANNPMGVHHAWGRTLKDVVARYHAMQGRDLRWQAGFDCQGLWVEVEVERALGFDSKVDIERYGVDAFARACRDRVLRFAAKITDQSRRLGMWMDWDRSYYTMADDNISAIWRFLAECHRRGWLYQGHLVMPWCHRCGTSLSQHELVDSYADMRHPSVVLMLPLGGGDAGERLAVWTTTPWTLPANVAVAVHPDASYVLVEVDGARVWVAEAALPSAFGPEPVALTVLGPRALGRDLAGRQYELELGDLPARREVEPRVVAWEEVSLEEGTGLVHIAPGCGAEDFALGAAEGLPVVSPLREDGTYDDGYGWLSGRHVDDVGAAIVERLGDAGMVLSAGELVHRYPVCWRCRTPLVQRVVDEWFIACDEVRAPMRAAARGVRWHPPQFGRRMDDWLQNMGDWCISRKRYWGLPLPFFRCAAGHLTVVGSKDELLARATSGADGLEELHRPWIDEVIVACETCAGEATRVREVGDCWLDAGIVAFSTLGWPDDHEHWQRWFPVDAVCEMHEQIRLWFYSLLFMSVVLDGRAPYRNVMVYSRVQDEHGREMHKSTGTAVGFDDAVERAGADTMRWLYASRPPARDLRFGYGALEAVDRRFLTFWNAYAFFVTYANIDGFAPAAGLKDTGPRSPALTLLDRWALARVAELVEGCRHALATFDVPAATEAFDRFADDLSNWYLRRSRDRFWRSIDRSDPDKRAAYETLWFCLVTALRAVAPIIPFVTDDMWENLVYGPGVDAPRSVHLDRYPECGQWSDAELLASMHEVRAVAALGRAARADASIRRRQPLALLVAVSTDPIARRRLAGSAGLVAAECNVKDVRVVSEAAGVATTELVADYARLGPRFKGDAPEIARLVAGGAARRHEHGYTVARWELDGEDLTVRTRARPGYAVAEGGAWVVGVDVGLTPELLLEGRARDLVRTIQQARKDLDLHVAARVDVTYPPEVGDVVAVHGAWIAEQTLARRLQPGHHLNLRQ